MTDTVKDLVDAMVKGDALETEKTFGAAMAEKLSGKLDDMRTNVAQTMFATEEEIETPVEEPTEETAEIEAVDQVHVDSEETGDIEVPVEEVEENA